jgi:putative hydrolase of the HAD superfamily
MMRCHLLIDADDTLWENNIYFERAFDEFVEFLNHSSMTPEEVRTALDEIELINNKIHGYGSANFARNMAQCYERLVEREVGAEDIKVIMSFAERILHHPIELIDGVQETLEYLAMRHDLVLFTKGHAEEQKLKVDRSGVGVYFGRTEIVKEKDADAYRKLAADLRADPDRTWMVGNSPKSDINPALEAGLNAVYVPHERTWHLERTDLADGGKKLLILENFGELRKHF